MWNPKGFHISTKFSILCLPRGPGPPERMAFASISNGIARSAGNSIKCCLYMFHIDFADSHGNEFMDSHGFIAFGGFS